MLHVILILLALNVHSASFPMKRCTDTAHIGGDDCRKAFDGVWTTGDNGWKVRGTDLPATMEIFFDAGEMLSFKILSGIRRSDNQITDFEARYTDDNGATWKTFKNLRFHRDSRYPIRNENIESNTRVTQDGVGHLQLLFDGVLANGLQIIVRGANGPGGNFIMTEMNIGGNNLGACPVAFTTPISTPCKCEGESSGCAVGSFCYGGGCKNQAQCAVRGDVDKNLFYGAKVYGNWNASTKIMMMNFTTPWDVSVSSMTWKNAVSDQLKYTSSDMGLWKKDMTDACKPTYVLSVPQTTYFGAGSKFNIRGSQLSTSMRVIASETVTTVKNGQTYTYQRSIKNTVPILVNLVTKTTISVRFRSTIAEPGPGPAPKLEDFVLFIGAEDNFADEDPNVFITMQVHSRACIDHTLSTTGVAVTTGLDNIAPGKASEFTWKKDANGAVVKAYEHNMCVETLYWKFVPKQYRENTYEISLEFTLRGTGEKFTSIAAIDIKQGDVLSDIGFTSDIKPYDDAACTKPNNKFILGQKFYTKITLSDLIVNTNNITCNTYKIKQTKNGVTTTTDLKAEAKYAFVEQKAELNSHVCGAELESHHFHISVDGYDTLLETEILITYDQTNTRRKLIRVPFTEEMFDAAGYDITGELALAEAEMSEEDMEFQNTKRAPDEDDMTVEMFIESNDKVGTILSSEAVQTVQNLGMIGLAIGCAGFLFGYVSRKYKTGSYVPLVEMQNE